MEYFTSDAFRSRSCSPTVLVALSLSGVLAAGTATALVIPHQGATAASPPAVQNITPPTVSHKEPPDGGWAPGAGDADDASPRFSEPHRARKQRSNPSPTSQSSSRTSSHRSGQGWYRPVTGYVITTRYGQPGNWAAGHHTGIDLAVPVGTRVVAIHGGTAVSAAYDKSYGNYVLIRHRDGFYALYAHMSRLAVRAGDTVKAGRRLGLSGATGRVTGPHIHFEVRTGPRYGSDFNPVALLRSHGIVL